MDRRTFLIRSASTLFAAAIGAGFYTWRIEPHWLRLVERTLPIRRLPAELDGRLLVHMSDFHTGRVDQSYLTRTLRRAAALDADYVVFTGDLINEDSPDALPRLASLLRDYPHGRRATVAILGNHDYGTNWNQPEVAEQVTRIATAAGISVLRNQAAMFDGLQIIGMDDLWARQFDPRRAFSGADPTAATLVLSHNPDTVDRPELMSGVDWILCGHTHGGQCKPPFLPPPLLPVSNRRYTAGEFLLSNGRRLYINRGVGHTLPVRFNVRPEVTVFTLRRA